MYNNLRTLVLAAALFATAPLAAIDGSLFLNPVGPVIPGTTLDAKALNFVSNSATFDAFLSNNTDPISEVYQPNAGDLIPGITIPFDSMVRMYFLDEDAGFSNSLGFVQNNNFDLTSAPNQNSLIFPQVIDITDPLGPPLDILSYGDYVDLGSFTAGTELDFFLIQDGADAVNNDGKTEPVFWSEPGQNNDGVQHFLMTEFALGGDIFYLISYEDLNLNSNANLNPNSTNPLDFPIDFTDGQFVLQVSVPEPSTYLMLGSCLMLAMFVQRRRQQTA